MDILFLAYYDNFCSCKIEQWKTMCSLFKDVLCGSLNIGKVAVSTEARNSFAHVKAKMVLILIETLDLENLLHMVHDEIPFREGGSVFSVIDIKEMDGQVSSFYDLGAVEAGPLLLAWAVFLSLLLSLHETHNSSTLMEIDHVSYVRQAFEVAAFDYILEILRNDKFRDSDGPVSGFLSVMRTFLSAFIASYELSHQKEDNTLIKILDILYHIYHGEESLALQFWDKECFVDGPIRSILFMLEKEYPIHVTEFVRLLSAVCEGSWPAECVYNYLDKMSGITTLFEISGGYGDKTVSDIIETHHPVAVPGVEGLLIPSGTLGRILKVLAPNIAFVYWECAHSGILLLLLRLTQDIHSDNVDDVSFTLNLFHRIISFNKALGFALLGLDKSLPIQTSKNSMQLAMGMSVDMVKIICTLIFKSVQDVSKTQILSVSLDILTEMLKCVPSHVIEAVVKSNIFDVNTSGTSSGTWLLSGGLVRLLMEDSGEKDDSYALAASGMSSLFKINIFLDFTVQLVEKGAGDNLVSAFIIFSLQYVFVNHMHWKYKSKHSCWKVTLKVFEVIKSCIRASKDSQKLSGIIWDILLYDSSIHNILCRIMCISAEALRSYISHRHEFKEIEDLQLAICSAFDVLCSIMPYISQETSSNVSALVQMVLSPSIKPLPVVQAAVSLISFSENSIKNLQMAVLCILDKEVKIDENLTIATFDLLSAVAYYQPTLLSSLIFSEEKEEVSSDVTSDSVKQLATVPVAENLGSYSASSPIEAIRNYVESSEILFDGAPHLLLSILNFLKALWEGGIQFSNILGKIRVSKKFWECLSSFLSPTHVMNGLLKKSFNNSKTQCLSLRYRCLGNVLRIMAHELFFLEKIMQCEKPDKVICTSTVNATSRQANVLYAQEILSTWFVDSSFLENLIKSFSDIEYNKEVVFRAKVAVCVCIIHLIAKLTTGNAGSLSMSLVKKIREIYNTLIAHSAFSTLLSLYSLRGYSEEKELTSLIISDLYYHLQGRLEGREIPSGPFQELSNFLLSLGTFECNDEKYERIFCLHLENISMFDIKKVQEEIGADLWDLSDWKTSKGVAESMFIHMHSANSSLTIASAKHFALDALVSVIAVYKGNMNNTKESFLHGRDISESAVESGIQYLCGCLQHVADMLVLEQNMPEGFLRVFIAQQELLLILSVILFKHNSHRTNKIRFLPLSILVTKSTGSIIKVCADVRPITPLLRSAVKLVLTLLLTSLEFSNNMSHEENKSDFEVKLLADASFISIGLLPVLCKYTQDAEYSNLSVATMDLIMKALNPDTWLPILRKHLPLQHILQNIQERDALASAPVIFNFLLTLGRTKGGAEMLYCCKFLSSTMVLLSKLHDGRPFSNNLDKSEITTIYDEKQVHIWVTSLAIIISLIQSLGDDISYMDIMVSALRYFFSEKPYMLSFYFSALNRLANDRSKKRAQTHKFQISLTALKLMENSLMLLCVLARYQASWIKGMKEMDSELRQTIIHVLAFTSRGTQRVGDSSGRSLTLYCQPTTKEDVELNRRPSFIRSRHGWFTLSTAGFLTKTTTSSDSLSTTLSVVSRDEENDNADLDYRSHFSDTIAIHIYRIVFLLLQFLCVQARAAVKRADEVEFVDLAYFPELPSPDILHGLQDQAIAIVTELCKSSKPNSIEPETESVCCLLLQILERSLYLELCVSQTCGIRPVLGRVEDFTKDIKGLIHVVEQHANFNQALKSLRQILPLMYPGFMKTRSFA
ncbi:mRNA transport [Musa troglodytarum]|uniref:mRNA transport n=1 Tax=Musa troglodytarum TaxID=320322 RepID=A0A9E7HL64_9LILI|nr:mRNA transport [Musa troglodytarum]URE36599.1 mRNA transport [Musa troglodytarum]